MRRVLKWVGIGFGALLGFIVIAALVLNFVGGARLEKKRVVEVEALPIPTDSAALARGQHLVHAICTGCHGDDLTGTAIFQDKTLGTFWAANITGLAAMRHDDDLVRAIRHAVGPDGRELVIMPAEALRYLSREDLGAVIAYLKTIPRTGNPRPAPYLTFVGKVLVGAGMFGGIQPAEIIDHHTPFPPMPEIGANVATGEYLSRFCYGCHGPNLTGGPVSDPASPPAPDLRIVKGWSESDWETFSQTGRAPEGRQVNPQFMPWEFFAKLDPGEREGLYLFLHSRP